MSDINLLDYFSIFVFFRNGELISELEYIMNGSKRNLRSCLDDGKYPKHVIFVFIICTGMGRKHKTFPRVREHLKIETEQDFRTKFIWWYISAKPGIFYDRTKSKVGMEADEAIRNEINGPGTTVVKESCLKSKESCRKRCHCS